jgi:pimeloyl-ACP methyl ester carboxylesterase
VVPVRGVIRRDYAGSSAGQLLVRRMGPADGRPLVLFHSSPLSGLSLERMMQAFATDRPVVAFDTPGNGDSASLPGTPEMREIAGAVVEAIESLGLDEYDVYGTHTGAMLAIEVGIARPGQVRHVVLDGVTMFTPDEIADMLPKYLFPLQITSDGSHLTWAWQLRRDMALWFPWYEHNVEHMWKGPTFPTAAALHANFVEFLKAGTTYHLPYRAAIDFPTRERLPLLRVPTLLCCAPDDVLRGGLAEAGALTPNATVRLTAGMDTPEQVAATYDLYRAFFADAHLPGT